MLLASRPASCAADWASGLAGWDSSGLAAVTSHVRTLFGGGGNVPLRLPDRDGGCEAGKPDLCGMDVMWAFSGTGRQAYSCGGANKASIKASI
jgi:hypothetical protein